MFGQQLTKLGVCFVVSLWFLFVHLQICVSKMAVSAFWLVLGSRCFIERALLLCIQSMHVIQ